MRTTLVRLVLAASALSTLAACGFDSVGWGRDPETGACPTELPGGAAEGEACDNAEDCAATCCGCPDGVMTDFAAVACLDGVCASADVACASVLEHQPEACLLVLDTRQEEGQCPAELATGAEEDDECTVAADCAGTCCACPDGDKTFEAAFCDDEECADADDACDEALEADPSLCE